MKITPESFREALGLTLRARRLAAGLSLASMGKRLSLSPGAISKIETGQQAVTIDQINAFARVFGADSWRILRDAHRLWDGTNGRRRSRL